MSLDTDMQDIYNASINCTGNICSNYILSSHKNADANQAFYIIQTEDKNQSSLPLN